MATAVVTEFTPAITWDFTATQTHFQVQVTSPDGQVLHHDSGKIKSAVHGYTLPKRVLSDNQDYRVVVYVWDDVPREGVTGFPSYVASGRVFHVDFDDSIAPPATLEANQLGVTPFIVLEWERDTAPNSFTIVRNDGAGEFALETDIAPSECEDPTTPGVYRWIDYSVLPARPHTYRVRAEVGGALSDVGPTVSVTMFPQGIWLLDPGTDEFVVLGGKEGISFAAPDNAETYTVLGSLAVVRSVMGLSGLSGTCTNLMLRTREGVTWDEYERRIYRFKERPATTFRLIMGDLNIPVILGNIVVSLHPETKADQVLKLVTFDWWQVGEHPFSGGL